MPKKTKTEIKTAIKNVLNKVTVGSTGGTINGSITIDGEGNFLKAPKIIVGNDDLADLIEEAGKVKTINGCLPDETGNISIPISVNNIQRDATGNITLTPADIGASASDHTHDYLPSDGKAVSATTADTATKATQDGSGQVITDNYIKAVSVSGRTVTFTRGNGTTFTITTQDTVTSNTSNWSVSNGTNGWARDNSTGFTINWGELGYPEKKSQDVWFPKSFSNVNYQVGVSFRKSSYANNTGCILTWERVSTSVVRISGGAQSSFTGCSYIAVGFS